MEARLFEEGTVPEWTTPEWYAQRETAPHLEQEGHHERLLMAADFVTSAIVKIEAEDEYAQAQVLDLGAGDGGLLSIVPVPKGCGIGFDLQQSNVDAAAARGVDVRLRNVIDDPSVDEYADLRTILVVTEMLEHLIDPHGFLHRLAATDARWLVASSPYTETTQYHYEYHTWAWDLEGYAELLEQAGWMVVRQATAWISQTVLARKP